MLFLFRLLFQLLSQSNEFPRKMLLTNLYRFVKVKIYFRFFCHRILQSAHYLSDSTRLTLRPLRSTSITLLHHYYGPLRLPNAATNKVIDSLIRLSDSPDTALGLPGSWLICHHALPPITPSSPSGALCCFFPDGNRLLHIRKDGHYQWCNEAETGSPKSGMRLMTSPSRGSPSFTALVKYQNHRPAYLFELPLTDGPRLHVEQPINTTGTFQPARSTKLRLAHRITQMNTDKYKTNYRL